MRATSREGPSTCGGVRCGAGASAASPAGPGTTSRRGSRGTGGAWSARPARAWGRSASWTWARAAAGLGHALTGAGAEDAAPSSARTGRIAFSSARSGTHDIWTSDADGGNPRPLTSDAENDSLPAISPDGSRVAFVSSRGGRRGLWLVSAEGGAPRSLVPVDVVDRPSWSPDGRSLVYAAEGKDLQVGLWVVSADGGAPVAVPGVRGRSPAWSPASDLIAYFTSSGSAGLRIRLHDQPRRIPPGPARRRNLDGRRLGLLLERGSARDRQSPGIGGPGGRRRGSRKRAEAQRGPAAALHGAPRDRLDPRRRAASSTASSSTRAGSCSSTASARR